jgi:hypothetical protein
VRPRGGMVPRRREDAMLKFMQIAVCYIPGEPSALYGLTADGTVYVYNAHYKGWYALPMDELELDEQGVLHPKEGKASSNG